MDRRTFLALALAAPTFTQTKKPAPQPAAAPSRPAGIPWTQWGGPAPELPDRGHGHQGHMACNGAPRHVEAAHWRRLFLAGRRG